MIIRLIVVMTLGAALVSLCGAQGRALEDPLPLKRVQIPAGRVALELERAGQGTLVQMPRTEFEAKVREAAEAVQAAKQAPRLLRASYAAEFDGKTGLLGRRGHWTVLNPGPGAALLPVGELNLALANFKNDEARLGILGDLAGKALALLVEKRGTQEFFFDWSLRGTPTSGGLRFELRVPASPVASLELKAPAEFQVVLPRGGAMVTAVPDGGKKSSHRQWVLHFSGSSRVEFVLRKNPIAGDLAPLIVTEIQSVQEIRPQYLVADFDFRVEVLHQSVTQLVFDGAPGLQVLQVVPLSGPGDARGLDVEKWEYSEGKPPDETPSKPVPSVPSRLTVHLREPFQGGPATLRVRCLAALPENQLWHSPALRVREALSRGERLKLVLVPDMRLEKFEPGSFTLQSGGFDADGKQTLTLIDRGEALAQRPRGVAGNKTAQFSVHQGMWWHIGGDKSTLTADLTYQVAQGRLFQLALRLPKALGWRVESVEAQPKELLRQWTPAGPLLVIDLERPLTSQRQLKLRVRLQSNPSLADTGATLDFPDLEPAERCLREGALAISSDARFQPAVVQASAPPSAAEPDGPWNDARVAHFFTFRGPPLGGKLRLVPRPPRLEVGSRAQVLVSPRGARVQVRFDVEALLGSADSVIVFVPEAAGERWTWKAENNAVRAVDALPGMDLAPLLLGAGAPGGPWGALGQAGAPRGRFWRITFVSPLASKQILIAETHIDPLGPPGAVQHTWRIPIPIVPQADRQEGDIHVQLRGAALKNTSLQSVQSQPTADEKGAAPQGRSERRFRFVWAPGTVFPRLDLTTEAVSDVGGVEICERAELTTYAEPGKRVVNHFRFLVWNWQRQALPVLLPSGSRVLGAEIDGRWIEPVPQHEVAAGVEVLLPAPAGDDLHHYQLIYTSAAPLPSLFLWRAAEGDVPQLPVPPVRLRRTWRLGPELSPLKASTLQRLMPRESDSVRETLRDAWTAADHWLDEISSTRDDWAVAQRQLLLSAEATLRRKGNGDSSLGELLQRLAFEQLKDQTPLLLDLAALHQAGIDRQTRASAALTPEPRAPFWERFDLVHVPCRAGALLTTRGVLERWQTSGGSASTFGSAHQSALRQAARFGRDPSGRFGALPLWLQAPRGDGRSRRTLQQLLPDALGSDWTEWEPLPQVDPAESLVLVSDTAVRLGAIALAVVTIVLALALARVVAPVWRTRLVLVWLAAAVLGLLRLPDALRGFAVAFGVAAILVVIVRRLTAPDRETGSRRRPVPATQKPVRAATTGAIVLVLALLSLQGVAAQAQASDPYLVLLLPEPAEAGGRQMVLVAPELLKRLDELGTTGASSLRHAALLSAEYKGQLTDDRAEFTAIFHFHASADQANLLLPLARVDLGDKVFLDGRPVFPVALPAPQQGYSLPVASKGLHRLEVSFAVRIPAGGEELRFTIPKVAQNQLELEVPREFQAVHVANAQGVSQVQTDGTRAIVRSHLGREASLVVKWRRDTRPALPADVQVSEAYFWDLRPPSPALTGMLNYTITKGLVSQLSVLLPDGIDVRSAEVSEPGLLGGAPLKAWSVAKKGNDRLVRLELVQPLAGRLGVKLDLIPRLGKSADVVLLKLPVPQGVKSIQGVLGYRLEDYEVEDKPLNVSVIAIAGEAFAKMWPASESAKVMPTRAYSFNRATANAGLLLSLAVRRPHTTSRIVWDAHPQHTDLNATLVWTAPGESLVLLEAEVPPAVALTAIEGPAVRQWTRSASRVQIWLDRPRAEATVQMRGYLKHGQKLDPGKTGRIVLPPLRLPGTLEKPAALQVRPATGLALEVERVIGLVRAPAPETSHTWTFTASTPAYEAVFGLKTLPQSADARVLTHVENQDGVIRFVSLVDYWSVHPEPGSFTVEARNWLGEDPRLQVSAAVQRVEYRKMPQGHTWTVVLAPGVTGRLLVRVSGQIPQSKGQTLPVPDVTISGADVPERYLAVVGAGLQPIEETGVERLKNLAQVLRCWPAESDRLRRDAILWRVRAAEWKLVVRPSAVRVAPSVHLLLAEHEAAPAREGRWIHEGRFLVYAASGTSLDIRLPAGAHPLALSVNGRLTPLRTADGNRVAVSLTDATRSHLLSIQWNYPPADEPFETPRQAMPIVENADHVPASFAIHLPAKTDLRAQAAGDTVVGRLQALLQRAEAELRLSKLLTDPPAAPTLSELLIAQRHLVENERLAIYEMGLAAKAGFDVQALRKRADLVREENKQLARERKFEAVRQEAEKQSLAAAEVPADAVFALADAGPPVFVPADAAAPPLLTSLPQEQWHETVALSQLLLLLLLLLVMASYFPWLWRLLSALWPEELAMLALLGWFFVGPSVFGALLLLTAVVARSMLALAGLRRWLTRPAPAPAGSSVLPTP